MAAPKGNQFWKLRSKHGRDKLFASPELMWDAAREYFQWCDENPLKEQMVFHSQGTITKADADKKRPYTMEALCHYLGCNTKYFYIFESNLDDKNDKDFYNIISRIRETIYNQKFEGAAAGFFNANIIARDLGLSDSKKHEHSGSVNIPVTEWVKSKDEQAE